MIQKIKKTKPRDEWIPNTWHDYANACGYKKSKKKDPPRKSKHKEREAYYEQEEN